MIVNTPVGSTTAATGVTLAAGDPTLIVLPSGLVYNTSNGYAIEMTADNTRIINHGEIYATSVAVRTTGTFTTIVNFGSIESQIQYSSASGINTVENHGTLTTFGLSYAVSGSASSFDIVENYGTIADTISQIEVVRNHGFIDGSVLSAGTASLNLTNVGGTITGSIEGGTGNDLIDLRGGTILGTVSGFTGDDTFIIDARTGKPGIERLLGGIGSDTIDLSNIGAAVWVDFDYNGPKIWTMDDKDLASNNPWRVVADVSTMENIIGSQGSDFLSGNNDNNTFFISAGVDRIQGDAGVDTFDASSFGSAIYVDLTYSSYKVWTQDRTSVLVAGVDYRPLADLLSVENIRTTVYNDYVFGDNADNTIFFQRILNGIDILSGSGGTDTIDFSSSLVGGVWVDLGYAGAVEAWTKSTVDVNAAGGTFTQLADLATFENIVGSFYGDYLVGDGLNNRIEGGKWNDVLWGQGGADQFVFNLSAGQLETSAQRDTIFDFVHGTDKIGIAGLNALPTIVIGNAPAPSTTAATLLYNTTTGVLSFDFDGTNAAAAIEIALLNNKAALTASDFLLVT